MHENYTSKYNLIPINNIPFVFKDFVYDSKQFVIMHHASRQSLLRNFLRITHICLSFRVNILNEWIFSCFWTLCRRRMLLHYMGRIRTLEWNDGHTLSVFNLVLSHHNLMLSFKNEFLHFCTHPESIHFMHIAIS